MWSYSGYWTTSWPSGAASTTPWRWRPPIVSSDGCVSFVNAPCSGIFIPAVAHASHVEQGQELGAVVDPLTGETCETLKSPASGLLFTLREYPVVYEGSLIARILGGGV